MFPYIHKFPECEDEKDFEVHQTSQKEINDDTDTIFYTSSWIPRLALFVITAGRTFRIYQAPREGWRSHQLKYNYSSQNYIF